MRHFKPPQNRPDNPCQFCDGSGVGVYGATHWIPCDVCGGTGVSPFKRWLPDDTTWRNEIESVVDSDDESEAT